MRRHRDGAADGGGSAGVISGGPPLRRRGQACHGYPRNQIIKLNQRVGRAAKAAAAFVVIRVRSVSDKVGSVGRGLSAESPRSHSGRDRAEWRAVLVKFL
jgi:hypothetical protein